MVMASSRRSGSRRSGRSNTRQLDLRVCRSSILCRCFSVSGPAELLIRRIVVGGGESWSVLSVWTRVFFREGEGRAEGFSSVRFSSWSSSVVNRQVTRGAPPFCRVLVVCLVASSSSPSSLFLLLCSFLSAGDRQERLWATVYVHSSLSWGGRFWRAAFQREWS